MYFLDYIYIQKEFITARKKNVLFPENPIKISLQYR